MASDLSAHPVLQHGAYAAVAQACRRASDLHLVSEAAILEEWQAIGRARVADHWAELENLVRPIGPLIDRKRYVEAALAAQIAANHAVLWHAGVFSHPELERLLRRLGEEAVTLTKPAAEAPDLSRSMAVLHVATELGTIGGHMRMLARWVRHDGGNVHSLALTRQNTPVPDKVRDAVIATRGSVHQLNLLRGGLLDWARALQALMVNADLIVLHAHSMDVIPILALAGMKNRPHTILLNHADHLFWLGVDFIDQVIHTRRSGLRLSIDRRGVATERNLLLPLCLEPQTRRRSREDAKKQLGLPPDCVLLLTIARALKFRPIDDISFADRLAPVLQANPDAWFIAVGPGGEVDWSAAEAKVPGRIQAVRQTPDTAVYLEAADIYVDSFPFASITSLFEAGLNGLPLVTRNPFGEGCEVIGADSPGLDPVILRARDIEDFQGILTRLIRDDRLRTEIGERTKKEIEAVNTGEGWNRELIRTYRQVFSTPRHEHESPPPAAPRLEKLDRLLPLVFGPTGGETTTKSRIGRDIETTIKTAPVIWRLRVLATYALKRQLNLFATPAWRLLIPEWLTARIRLFVPKKTGAQTSPAQQAASEPDRSSPQALDRIRVPDDNRRPATGPQRRYRATPLRKLWP